MREKIYTIPVNESFDEAIKTRQCPFCIMKKRLERERVTYTLGASMMEPDARMLTNAMGFCQNHFQQLFDEPNKLSFALVLDTHLKSINDKIETIKPKEGERKKLFSKKDTDTGAVMSAVIKSAADSCAICKSVETTMERYIDVFFYMWEHDSAFKEKFLNCEGICLPHFAELAKKCGQYLKGASAETFLAELYEKEKKLFAKLGEDVHKFTLKFDYRNKDMPWGDAKDAPARASRYLSGADVGDNGEEDLK